VGDEMLNKGVKGSEVKVLWSECSIYL